MSILVSSSFAERHKPGFHVLFDVHEHYHTKKDPKPLHGPFVRCYIESYAGCCIKTEEFMSQTFVIVWDKVNQESLRICVTTFKFTTKYTIDADMATIIDYEKWKLFHAERRWRTKRSWRARCLLDNRKKAKELAKILDVDFIKLSNLRNYYSTDHFLEILKILSPGISNPRKVVIRNHILEWLRDPTTHLKKPSFQLLKDYLT